MYGTIWWFWWKLAGLWFQSVGFPIDLRIHQLEVFMTTSISTASWHSQFYGTSSFAWSCCKSVLIFFLFSFFLPFWLAAYCEKEKAKDRSEHCDITPGEQTPDQWTVQDVLLFTFFHVRTPLPPFVQPGRKHSRPPPQDAHSIFTGGKVSAPYFHLKKCAFSVDL